MKSAGLLLHRDRGAAAGAGLEVWIAHMGGPFWARKQQHAWSIPKGEFGDDEEPLVAALREFAEEVGVPAPTADYVLLGEFRQRSGKVVTVFAGDAPEFEVDAVRSNTFELEWPPHSGRMQRFPEIDEGHWMPIDAARPLLVTGQVAALDALVERLSASA
ncbi:NUDIX domain-containing protein [Schumannella luteola]|uniref:Putative NUDIX family NTP pyrophosphohydrolase n=1 Tax=Schumannella luteola TaxID=472059 RepID=A0A852YK55_9MICO|nr:NUDIX domain-containing protein [Schumannella luteola]NYH00368.1 putative NUDIX family NTP pyrophosphohydrolase [Schumannella luteola]TPX05948.1 NUDIX domain-containing protein [Schumannella luteola]